MHTGWTAGSWTARNMKGQRLVSTLSCEVTVRGQRSAAHTLRLVGLSQPLQRVSTSWRRNIFIFKIPVLSLFPHKCGAVTKAHILIQGGHSARCRLRGKVCVVFQPHWTHVRL